LRARRGKTVTGSEVKKKTYVEFLGLLVVSDVVGKKKLEVDVSGETVKDVIDELIKRYGSFNYLTRVAFHGAVLPPELEVPCMALPLTRPL
jgi:molybdopterin converting factor small subunit